jgi:hypothetical protein
MQIKVTVQTMNLPEDIRKSIEAACDHQKAHSRVQFNDIIVVYRGPRCPRDGRGIPTNNLVIEIPVPDIDDGTDLPSWMKGVDHQVELTESTSQQVPNGRYRFGSARGEVNSYETSAGYNPAVTTTKIRINAKGKYAYKQTLALLGKIRTGELIRQYHKDTADGKHNHNVIEHWA